MSKLSVISLLGLLIVVMIAATGCEVGSAIEPIKISPSTVMVKKGQSVAFTAEGGYEYTWSLSGSGTTANVMGFLSTTRGPSVVYTSLYDPGSNFVNETISVVSSIIGDAAGTNSDSSLSGGTGTATITHVGANF